MAQAPTRIGEEKPSRVIELSHKAVRHFQFSIVGIINKEIIRLIEGGMWTYDGGDDDDDDRSHFVALFSLPSSSI